AQCLPFISCPVISVVTSFIACNAGQNAGQSFSVQDLAANVSAGAQCLPFISCPVISVVTSFIACNAGQNAGQSFSAQNLATNNQTGSMNLSDYKQILRQYIEQIETLEKTNGHTNKVD
ncbi:hypothetical protein, partial [Peribacillus butanolivorans]|uniref:hypothetical protein n=1 Tax=Peribacillus butanolivorans TaxID=421767 RepID=UPI0036DEF9FA